MMNLMSDLQDRFALAYLFVSHNLAVVRQVSNRVAVMYLGKIVEQAGGDELYATPRHPYTGALLSAVPVADPVVAKAHQRQLLTGDVPSPTDPPSGCRFHPRCPRGVPGTCDVVVPELIQREGSSGLAACHFPLATGPDQSSS
jgi:oligopeptide/dipeptide ABC transporter ATP-binding protein